MNKMDELFLHFVNQDPLDVDPKFPVTLQDRHGTLSSLIAIVTEPAGCTSETHDHPSFKQLLNKWLVLLKEKAPGPNHKHLPPPESASDRSDHFALVSSHAETKDASLDGSVFELIRLIEDALGNVPPAPESQPSKQTSGAYTK